MRKKLLSLQMAYTALLPLLDDHEDAKIAILLCLSAIADALVSPEASNE